MQFSFLGGDTDGYTVTYNITMKQCATYPNTEQTPVYGAVYSGYVLIEPDGTKHPFPAVIEPVGSIPCSYSGNGPLLSSDGSGWILNVGFTSLDRWPRGAIRKDGTIINVVNGAASYQVNAVDRNGNN